VAILHVQQIRGYLQKTFGQLIDIADYADASTEQRENVFLSRAVAALALMHLADIPAARAAATITDGTGDNGIDAVHFDESERRLYLVQSKWSSDGRGSIDRGDIQKYITGFHDIVNTRFNRFNAKVQSKKSEIESAVFDATTKLVAVIAYTGQDSLADDCQRDVDDLLREMNQPTETVEVRLLRQVNLHGIVASGAKGSPINLEVALVDWGQVKEPFHAIYGQVAAADVAVWADAYHPRLFAPNLRMFLGRTEANDGMIETLRSNPEHFWYFNNGITALCAGVKKKPIGGASRENGVFEVTNVSIVNGAQTVGALASARAADAESLAQARVFIRFISLEHMPEDIATAVARFTNTQNRIERRDFVALDPQQERIRTELQIENIEYVYKSGHSLPADRLGFDVTEATVALACMSDDVGLAVQAKREIGKLWEDISKVPYRALFNPSVSGPEVWRSVRVLRIVEAILQREQKQREGRDRMFAVHGNRLIEWLLFQGLKDMGQMTGDPDSTDLRAKIEHNAVIALDTVAGKANGLYGTDVYLASLFKNLTKCRAIVNEIRQA
jgi:hypothetical protein